MFSSVLLIAIVALSIGLMLARPRGIAEVYWAGSGALLLVALGLIPLRLAGHAIAEGLDVYLFLIGMMLLSALAHEHGVFDWLSSVAVSGARGSNVRLFTLIYLFGVVVTVFLSNDATAVVLTPAVLAAVRRARVKPLPYLYACAMVANAASFALPISNPANLVVFRGVMPTLGRWLTAFGVSSLLSVGATYLVLRIVFRKELGSGPEATEAAMRLSGNGRLVLAGLAGMVIALLTASAKGIDLGWPTCGLAVLVTVVVSIRARRDPVELLGRISWKTLALVAALFILVDAVIGVGALTEVVRLLHRAEGLAPAWGVLAVSFSIGLGNNLVNNLPLGLIVGAATQAAHLPMLMRAAVMMGIDLGSNLSITGSLATILWLIALRREKLNVGFVEFLKVGVWVMPAGIAAAAAGALAMRALHFL